MCTFTSKHVSMSVNPPVYTESPHLYQKVSVPEFVKKRLLIITYFNMGYSISHTATQLSLTEKYCDEIIRIFQTYGLKALMKRDFGLRKKKDQKKLNDYELSLLQSLVRHTPPKNYNKWTFQNLSEIISHSDLFENQISLCSLRSIMLSKEIKLNEWQHNPLDPDDVHFQTISDLININDFIIKKSLNDYELDITLTERIIDDLLKQKKAINILNVFLNYKQHYNLPKLSIYKFSQLLKNQFPQWETYKQESQKIHTIKEKKIELTETDVNTLVNIAENTSLPRICRMRAAICLELNTETNIKDIEEKTGLSRSMVYRVYHRYKNDGLNSIYIKKRESQKTYNGINVPTTVKKYPNIIVDIQDIVSSTPEDKTKWTIEKITYELRKRKYSISTTSVSKIIHHNRIAY